MLEHVGRKDTVRLQGLSPSECPVCRCKIYECCDGKWTEWICWRCGHYESDTPAFKAYPDLFHDIVRKNRDYFLVKYTYSGRDKVRHLGTNGR